MIFNNWFISFETKVETKVGSIYVKEKIYEKGT
nr:MAG TPA: hypothetical protein [Caudoviricetes sp.]